MLQDFFFALNAVLPIFAVAFMGYMLKYKNFLTDEFVKTADKLVFKVMLPCLLFAKVAYIDRSAVAEKEIQLIAFCVVSVIVLTFLLCLVVPRFVKDNAKTGAFIQGVFRSNVAFLGVPFAISLFGDEGGTVAAIVLAVVVPLYNVLAVAVLCIFDPKKSETKIPLGKRIADILVGIIKNPLIISIAVALPFGILGLGDNIPVSIVKTIDYFSSASTTLALITIGASFKFSELRGRIGLAGVVALLKNLLLPALMMAISYYGLGFTGVHLGIVMIVFGTPTAISSSIMAKNMNSDGALANQIVLLTTFCCMFTIFAFSFILRVFGLV